METNRVSRAVGAIYRLSVIERFRHINTVHQVGADGSVWATSGRKVLHRKAGAWHNVAAFPFGGLRDCFGWSRLLVRALRTDKCTVFANSEGAVLGVRRGSVFLLPSGGRPVLLQEISGNCPLPRGVCEDRYGWTHFGEYCAIPRRTSVRIWRLPPDLRSCEVAYTFPPGAIWHIHGLFRDSYDPDALWGTTGDLDGECCIFRSRDGFRTVERFGDGTQIWRAVGLFFTPTHVCWLTDSYRQQNHACRMDRRTLALEVGDPMASSTFTGTTTTDGLYVAFTIVEPGPAIQRRESLVLVSDDAFHWTEAASFRKDGWKPLSVFGFGLIACPTGSFAASNLYLSGQGLVGLDGTSVRVSIDRDFRYRR